MSEDRADGHNRSIFVLNGMVVEEYEGTEDRMCTISAMRTTT